MAEQEVKTEAGTVVDLEDETPIRVLHVDDECGFLKVAKECLEMQGNFEVETVLSVEEALDKMKRKDYDVVVSDYQMPSKDGLEFLRELRQRGNGVPFIIFTGRGREQVTIAALNMGADQYVDKAGAPESVYGELAYGIKKAVKRKKTEKTLQESLMKLDLILSSLEEGVDIVSHDYVVQYQNKFLKDRFGSLTGKKCYVGYMGFKEPCPFCSMRKAIEHSKTFRVELTGKDGRDYELVSMPFEHADGRVDALEVVRDISERKRSEHDVRQSQQKFEALFRGTPEATVYLGRDFRILDVNPRFCQLFGYSAEEAKGKHINEVVVPEDMMEEAERLDSDAENGYARHETVRRRKDGSLVPVSISAAPVTFEGRLLGYIGVYKDITDLKRAHEESEESRRHFQTLFNLMADPVAIVSETGRILEVTQKVQEITGFRREDLVGRNFLKTKIATTRTKAIMIKNLAKRMLGMHIPPYEVEMLSKDGRRLPYEINATKIQYKGKHADLVVFRDVSERKKLEEKLRVVGSLTRHDVRNKLSTVTGNAYLLRQRLAGDSRAQEYLKDTEVAVCQVERIFDFARTYERLGIEQLTDVDVGKAVNEAVSLFADLKDVEVVNECNGLAVLADSLLRQLFYNLIDNSLKYGEKVRQIRVYYKRPNSNNLELVYEDDGIGIPHNMRSSLFKEGGGKGTGYGLFMIRRICEVYGWTIDETGEQGKGVRFKMSIAAQ